MGKKVQAGSDGQPGKRRKKRGKQGKSGGSGGSHAPMTPAEEAAAERKRRMDVTDGFTAGKRAVPPYSDRTDPFHQNG